MLLKYMQSIKIILKKLKLLSRNCGQAFLKGQKNALITNKIQAQI